MKEKLIHFSVDKNRLIKKGTIIAKSVLVTPYYEITFKINPQGEISDHISNVLHFTTGKDNGEFGARTPSVWFEKGGSKLIVCSGIGKNHNECFKINTTCLSMNLLL